MKRKHIINNRNIIIAVVIILAFFMNIATRSVSAKENNIISFATDLPSSISYYNQELVELHVEVSENTGDNNIYTYNWMYMSADGTEWEQWIGEGYNTNTTKYRMPSSFDGLQMRCTVTDNKGNSVQSNVVTLRYQSNVHIIKDLCDNVKFENNEDVRLSIETTNDIDANDLHYNWQYQIEGNNDWEQWVGPGYTTKSTHYNMPRSFDGVKLRCIVSDSLGNIAVTKATELDYQSPIKIKKDLENDVYFKNNEYITLHVDCGSEENNKLLNYQWQYQVDGSDVWEKWVGDGYQTNTTGYCMPKSFDGVRLRCLIFDQRDNCTVSKVTTLHYMSPIQIVHDLPSNIDYSNNELVTLEIELDSSTLRQSGIKYSWLYLVNGGDKWEKWVGDGYTTAKTTYPMPKEFDGVKFKCIVRDDNGDETTSHIVTIHYKTPIIIDESVPTQVKYTNNENIELHIQAEYKDMGTDRLLYNWEYKVKGGDRWEQWVGKGYSTNTTSYNMPASFDGLSLRCEVFNQNGDQAYSPVITLCYYSPIKITQNLPSEILYYGGERVTLHVEACEEIPAASSLKYNWQYKVADSDVWEKWVGNGYNTCSTDYKMPKSFDGLRMRCIIEDDEGNISISDESILKYYSCMSLTEDLPSIIEYTPGEIVKLHVAVDYSKTTDGICQYNWQYRYEGDSSWQKWVGEGYETDTTQYAMPKSFDGLLIRCNIIDSYGNEITSSQTMLKSCEDAPTIIAQSDYETGLEISVPYGKNYTLQATTDDAISIKWLVSYDNGATFNLLDNTGNSLNVVNNNGIGMEQIVVYRIETTSSRSHVAQSNMVYVHQLGEDELPVY